MGAWGYGLLQNDTALDGQGEVTARVEESVRLFTPPSEGNAARLGAAVGLLLLISPYSFDAETPFRGVVYSLIDAHRLYLNLLPGDAGKILDAVSNGQVEEMAEELARIHHALDAVLYDDPGCRSPLDPADAHYHYSDLFRHPAAREWLAGQVAAMAATVDEGFSDEEIVTDLGREGECMGAFTTLLLLGPDYVDRGHFARWRTLVSVSMEDMHSSGDPMEDEFETRYYDLLDRAFSYILGNRNDEED